MHIEDTSKKGDIACEKKESSSSVSSCPDTVLAAPAVSMSRKEQKRAAEKEKILRKREEDLSRKVDKYLRGHPDADPEQVRKDFAEKARAKRAKKRKKKPLGSIALMLIGFLLLAFPIISDLHASWVAANAITSYTTTVEQYSEEDKAKMFSYAYAYNRALLGAYEEGDPSLDGVEYEDILDVATGGIMGSIEIDSIGVNQPIYHGTEDNVLMSGTGHMEATSFPLPMGGSHAAIAGHTGMPGQRMFDELVDLEPGDLVKINILDTTTVYQVDGSEVVEPDYVFSFRPERGEDLLTLITCTPYGINDHRLLVHCHAIGDAQSLDWGEIYEADKFSKYLNLRTLPMIITVGIAICAILFGVIKRKRKKKKKKQIDAQAATKKKDTDGKPDIAAETASSQDVV